MRSLKFEAGESPLPFLSLGMAVGMLGLCAARAGGGVRLASIAGLVAIAMALIVPLRSAKRSYGDDHPGWNALLDEVLAGPARFVPYLGAATAFLFIASVAPGSGARDRIPWLGPLMAGLGAIAIAVVVAGAVRSLLRTEGVERQALLTSSSIAFFVSIVLVGAWSCLEAVASAPAVPMLAVWLVALAVWGAVHLAISRG